MSFRRAYLTELDSAWLPGVKAMFPSRLPRRHEPGTPGRVLLVLLRQEHAQQDGEIGLPTASMRVEVRVSSPEPAVGESIAPGTRQARLWPQGNRFGEDAWFMYTRSRS